MKMLAFLVALVWVNSSYAQRDQDSVTQAKELIRSMCLVGSGYEMSIGANGKISISKMGADGQVKFSKRELEGVVDVPDPDKHEELDSIRECTKPYIPRLLDILLKDAGSTSIREDGTSETLVRSKYATEQEMRADGCGQAQMNAIDRAKDRCAGKFYDARLISCNPTRNSHVTTYKAVVEAKCKESA